MRDSLTCASSSIPEVTARAPEERPQERLLRHGAATLTPAELLALLIRTGTPRRSALALAEQVLSQTGGLRRLAATSPHELCRIPGVGPAKASQVLAGLELGRRLMAMAPEERRALRSPGEAAGLVMPEMRFLAQEHFRVLLLDAKNRVIANELVSIGTLNTSLVHPRELFRRAIQASSAAVILVHNHPSGDPTPSAEDLSLTKRLVEAGRLLGIEVLDHLVIGDNRYVSLKERGLL
ncbi:MAG: RadC family protein [Chitinophagales bacterium]